MPNTWKTVRVFISSTFRDMQAERDHLVRFVFPRLREQLLPRGIHLVDIDLRWGVTSGQDASEVCREIINECRPRFLCILGGRYGWVPPGKTRSITADEVHYGVLDRTREDRGFAYFYLRDDAATIAIEEHVPGEFREPPSSANQSKLSALKQSIIDAGLSPFVYPATWDNESRRVAGLKRFGDRVYDDLLVSIKSDPDLRERFAGEAVVQTDEFAAENEAMEALIEERSQAFVLGSRQPVLSELLNYAGVPGGNGYVCLVGPPGSGKSALLAHLCRQLLTLNHQLRAENQPLVIPHFVGASVGSTDGRHTLRRFCHELKKACPEITLGVPDDFEKLRAAFPDWLRAACVKRRILIVLDAINEFDPTPYFGGSHWLPEELPENARIILSALDGPALEQLRRRRLKPHEIELKPLTAADGEAIIEQFRQRYHKRLDSDQRAVLLAKADAGAPLYLMAALEELRTLGTYEEITRRITDLPITTRDLFVWILERLGNDDGLRDAAGQKIGEELVSRFAALLGASRYGLSQRELVELLATGNRKTHPALEPDSQGNVGALLRLLQPYLMRRGELLDFYHGQFKAAAEQRYLRTEEGQSVAHDRLVAHFDHPANAAQAWDHAPARSLTEFPYHLWKSGSAEALFDLVRSEEFLTAQNNVLFDNPDQSLQTIRWALDQACTSGLPIVMAEFTLAHASRRLQLQTENPVDILLNKNIPPEIALRRSWMLAEALEPPVRAYALLLLAWNLKILGRSIEVSAAIDRLDVGKLPSVSSRFDSAVELVLAWLEPDVDVSRLAPALLVEDWQLRDLAGRLTRRSHCAAAMRVALQIKDPFVRATAMGVVASTQAKVGEDPELALEEAVAASRQIDKGEGRAQKLAETAVALAETGGNPEALLADAFSVAASIASVGSREIALSEVATAQAKVGRFDDALATADLIPASHDRSWMEITLREIAAAQAQSGRFLDAYATAARIREPSLGGQAVGRAALAQARSGRFDEAVAAASAIKHLNTCAWSLVHIAREMESAGRNASTILDDARTAALRIKSAIDRGWELAGISICQAELGRIEDAFITASEIGDDKSRVRALCGIAESQSKAGVDPTGTFSSAKSSALTAANKFVTDHDALEIVAVAQARAGFPSDALGTYWQRVGLYSNTYEFLGLDADLLSKIAEVQEKSPYDAARTLAAGLDARFRSLERISKYPRAAALQAMVRVQIGSGRFEDAVKLAQTIEVESWRDEPWSEIARGLAKAQRFTEARVTALRVANLSVRGSVLASLAAALASANRFSEALLTASEIDDDRNRVEALCQIGAALKQANHDAHSTFSRARKLAAAAADWQDRVGGLYLVAAAQARAGYFAAARATARKIDYEWPKAEALGVIAGAEARVLGSSKANFDLAQTAAAAIGTDAEHAKALRAIATEQWLAGVDSSQTDAQLLSLLAKQSGEWGYELARDISVAQAKSNRFDAALVTARLILDSAIYAEALGLVASEQSRAGVDASPTLAAAIQALREGGSATRRSNAMIVIAPAQVRADDFGGAWMTYDNIPDRREDCLRAIGASLVERANAVGFKAEMRNYLPRAAEGLKTAWQACDVLGWLFPDQANQLSAFLARFPSGRTASE